MPLYEYQCRKCGQRFERLVSISDAVKRQPCPHCGGKDTEKQLSIFAAKSSSSSSGGIPSGGGFT
ncbi:MAG: zinc ribbon domain-containing protein [Deltaproteobacteria bacterium]|nr:zinc ribbon domain-containing protein [Deltaproteobacteria bacterium]